MNFSTLAPVEYQDEDRMKDFHWVASEEATRGGEKVREPNQVSVKMKGPANDGGPRGAQHPDLAKRREGQRPARGPLTLPPGG